MLLTEVLVNVTCSSGGLEDLFSNEASYHGGRLLEDYSPDKISITPLCYSKASKTRAQNFGLLVTFLVTLGHCQIVNIIDRSIAYLQSFEHAAIAWSNEYTDLIHGTWKEKNVVNN